MLDSLKKLFKNNTKLIKISDSIYSDKKIYSYEEITRMEELIKELIIENNFKRKQIDFLQETIKNIWR